MEDKKEQPTKADVIAATLEKIQPLLNGLDYATVCVVAEGIKSSAYTNCVYSVKA